MEKENYFNYESLQLDENHIHLPVEIEEVHRRLALINIVLKTGNISKACRLYSCSRKSFYKWQSRYEKYGIFGLIDKKPGRKAHNSHFKHEQLVKQLALDNPGNGPAKISDLCKEQGIAISPSSIQKFLNRINLGKMKDRIISLEKEIISEGKIANNQILRIIENHDTRFRDRSLFSNDTVNLIQGVRCFQALKDERKIHIQVAIDTRSLYTFYHIHKGPTSFDARHLLENKVFDFYGGKNKQINCIYTPSNKIYLEKGGIYREYLKDKGISHKVIANLSKGGFLGAFFKDLKSSEIIRDYNNIVELRKAFSEWVDKFNNSKIHCFPNFNRAPIDYFK